MWCINSVTFCILVAFVCAESPSEYSVGVVDWFSDVGENPNSFTVLVAGMHSGKLLSLLFSY